MQPFFTSILTTTFGGQFAPKKGGQFDRIFHRNVKGNKIGFCKICSNIIRNVM